MVRFLLFLPSRRLSVSDPCQRHLFVSSAGFWSVSSFPAAEASGCPPISIPVYGMDWYPAIQRAPLLWYRPTNTALLRKRILTSSSNLQLPFTKVSRVWSRFVRFSPSLYPIAGVFGKESGGQALFTDLCQTARSLGNCALASNAGGGGKSRNLPTRTCIALH